MSRSDEIYNLACPASPVHYQHDPVQTTKTSVHRRDQHARPGQAREGDGSSRPRPARSMATRPSIRSRRPIGAMSTRSASAPATTRASAAPRRCSSTITASTGSTSRWRASSTPMARACTPTTAAWCPTSSCRRCGRSRSPSMATAARPAPSAIVDDLIDGFIRLMDSRPTSPARSTSAIPGEFTIRELAEQVIELTGSKSKLIYPAAAPRRPEAAPAGHHARPQEAGLGAEGSAAATG